MAKYGIEHLDLFKNVDSETLEAIEDIVIEEHYETGDTIFTESSAADGIYFILAGKIGVYKKFRMKKRVLINQLLPGTYFGELSLLHEGQKRTATCVALEPTQMGKIPFSYLLDLMKKNSAFSISLISTLAEKEKSAQLREQAKLESSRTLTTEDGEKIRHGRVICFSGFRDGLGKSTNASVFAETLAMNREKKILLLDLDVLYDDLNYFYDLMSNRTLGGLIEEIRKKEVRLYQDENEADINFEQYLNRLSENFYLLPADPDFSFDETSESANLGFILKNLKKLFDYIVVDAGCNMDELQNDAMHHAEKVVFHLSDNDLIDVKNSIKFLRVLNDSGHRKEDVGIVLSFHPTGPGCQNKVSLNFPIIGKSPVIKNPQRIEPDFFIGNTDYYPLFKFWGEYSKAEFFENRDAQLENLKNQGKGFLSFFFRSTEQAEEEGPKETAFMGEKEEKEVQTPAIQLDLSGLLRTIENSLVRADFEGALEKAVNIGLISDNGPEYYRALAEYSIWVNDALKTEMALKKFNHLSKGEPFMEAMEKFYSRQSGEFKVKKEAFEQDAEAKGDPELLFQAGFLNQLWGGVDKALDFYKKALCKNVDNPKYAIFMLNLLEKRDDDRQYLSILKRLDSHSPFFLSFLGRLAIKLGFPKLAFDTLLPLSSLDKTKYFQCNSLLYKLAPMVKKLEANQKLLTGLIEEEGKFVDSPEVEANRVKLLATVLELGYLDDFEEIQKTLEKPDSPEVAKVLERRKLYQELCEIKPKSEFN